MKRVFASLFPFSALAALYLTAPSAIAEEPVPVGIIGLDTSHAPAFAKLLNTSEDDPELSGFRVVAANVKGSDDLEVSVVRQEGITEQMVELGIEITDSIEELLDQVEAVFLTSNDGHVRLEQTLQVIRAGKPVFVDKPASASLADLIAIFEGAKKHDVPIFTSSSLRYIEHADEHAAGKHGHVLGADTYGPASLEASHPDFYWYLVHAVEMLVTIMGPEIETVARAWSDEQDVAVVTWKDGRIGTVRGMRERNPGMGGTVFTSEGTFQLGKSRGYRPLVVEAVSMFRSGEVPVPQEQSIAVYALMDAADRSKELGGAPVNVPELIAEAREQAAERLKEANAALDQAE